MVPSRQRIACGYFYASQVLCDDRGSYSLYYVGVAVGTSVTCMGESLINRKLYLVAELSAGCNRGLEYD